MEPNRKHKLDKKFNPPITIQRGESDEQYISSRKSALIIGRSADWLRNMSINGHINRYKYMGGINYQIHYRRDELENLRKEIIRRGYADRINKNPGKEIDAPSNPNRKELEEELSSCERRISQLIDRLTTLFLSSEDYDHTYQQYANETVRYKRIQDRLSQFRKTDHR